MVKKITKYAKFMVCCALILSLVAPSYAALSASDGSAFVTKAEFDSALADFNARLTTFEAGINSKIDSQVTSYLDRNGIWNGKEQVINQKISHFAGNNFPDDMCSASRDWNGSCNSRNIFVFINREIIHEISKSGLIFISWGIGYRWGGWAETQSSSCIANLNICFSQDLKSTDTSSNAKYSTKWHAASKTGSDFLYNEVIVSAWHSHTYTGLSGGAYHKTATFFVSKGLPLYQHNVFYGAVFGQVLPYIDVAGTYEVSSTEAIVY